MVRLYYWMLLLDAISGGKMDVVLLLGSMVRNVSKMA